MYKYMYIYIHIYVYNCVGIMVKVKRRLDSRRAKTRGAVSSPKAISWFSHAFYYIHPQSGRRDDVNSHQLLRVLSCVTIYTPACLQLQFLLAYYENLETSSRLAKPQLYIMNMLSILIITNNRTPATFYDNKSCVLMNQARNKKPQIYFLLSLRFVLFFNLYLLQFIPLLFIFFTILQKPVTFLFVKR